MNRIFKDLNCWEPRVSTRMREIVHKDCSKKIQNYIKYLKKNVF